jgi:sugar lactone lactonase YvrE
LGDKSDAGEERVMSRSLFGFALAGLALALGAGGAQAQVLIDLGSGLANADGVAVDGSGNVFVAEIGNGGIGSGAIKEIPAAGIGSTVLTLGNGYSLVGATAVDASGNIFVINQSGVAEFPAASGNATMVPLGGPFIMPEGLALDGNGNLFVADYGNGGTSTGAVYEMTAASGYTTVTKLTSGPADFQSVTVDGTGNVFVTGYVGAASSQVIGVFELQAADGYSSLKTLVSGHFTIGLISIAVDAGDDVFVIDPMGGTQAEQGALYEFAAAGNYATQTQLGLGLTKPTSVAVDQAGNLFVAAGTLVQELPVSGGYATLETLAQPVGQAAAIALDPAGNVFVADNAGVALDEIPAAGGYAQVKSLIVGLSAPSGVALDGSGNLFIADHAIGGIFEMPAAGGYTATKLVHGGFTAPLGLAIDGSGNIFVVDANGVEEMPAAGGYSNVVAINTGTYTSDALAVDAAGNLYVAQSTQLLPPMSGPEPVTPGVLKLLAAGGYTSSQMFGMGHNFAHPTGVAVDRGGNIFVTDAGIPLYTGSVLDEMAAADSYASVATLFTGFSAAAAVATDRTGNLYVADEGAPDINEILVSPAPIMAAILPGGRSVELGTPATVFASMINTTTASLGNCRIALGPGAPQGLSLSYQTTDPATNAPTGMPDTPVTIPGNDGSQSFVIAFQGTTAFSTPALQLAFTCDGAPPAPVIPGVDTVDLSMSATPVPDIIAISATPSGNGILTVPAAGAAFAVAGINVGVAAPITVSASTGADVSLSLCQTNPVNAQCLAAPAGQVTLNFAARQTATFSIFVMPTGSYSPFAPTTSRIDVLFRDASNADHGSTSVAVDFD